VDSQQIACHLSPKQGGLPARLKITNRIDEEISVRNRFDIIDIPSNLIFQAPRAPLKLAPPDGCCQKILHLPDRAGSMEFAPIMPITKIRATSQVKKLANVLILLFFYIF